MENSVPDDAEASMHSSLLCSPNKSPDRRCSARFLSKSVALTLRQLQADEHRATVSQIVRSNERFYHRQQLCETIFMVLVLTSFTGFSIYLVLAHGFHHFNQSNFTLVYTTPTSSRKSGEKVELMCQTDQNWEWCRWVYMDSYCEWEWISSSVGVENTGCNMVDVEFIGDYNLHQCGLRLIAETTHEGEWLCEIEKYHPGFTRRYGEVLYGKMTLSVIENPLHTQATTTTTTLAPTTNITEATTTSPAEDRAERERVEYEHQFLILRIVVRCSVTITLLSLVCLFGLLFLHSWKSFEANKPVKLVTDTSTEDISQEFQEMDPLLMKRILQTRRKSVAFSICVLDRDSMTFEMDRKKVQLSSTDRITNSSFCPLPTLKEDCENEKISLPLSLATRHKIKTSTFNRARRMSLPPCPLTQGLLGLGDEIDGPNILCAKKFGDSIETIM